jgi:hypothetical protein
MRQKLGTIISIFILSVASIASSDPRQQPVSQEHFLYPSISGNVLKPVEPPGVELTEKGKHIRGVYAPVAKLAKWTPRQLLSWVKTIGANAIIMDIKDDLGRITFTKKHPKAKGAPHGVVSKMRKFVKILKKNDIYTIGRLVCFKDDVFHKRNPEAAIRDRRDGKVWRDRAKMAWLDPFSLKAHEYIASIAKAAEKIGFDEIQLDYVRFPVDGLSRYAKFTNKETGMERYEAIALLLARVDMTIGLPLSIDVFGLTAHRPGDRQGLGQSLEHLAPYIDAISPMLYIANWPKETWENPDPKKNYALVHDSVKRIRARLSDAVAVRPLLQGFAYRAANFGVEFINNQIVAAKTAGSSGYLFWNQGGNYSKVSTAWQRLGMRANTDYNPEEKTTDNKKVKSKEKSSESESSLNVASNK